MTTLTCDRRNPQRIADLYDQAESRKSEGSYAEAGSLYRAALAALVPGRAELTEFSLAADDTLPQDDSQRRIRLIELRILTSVGDLYRLQGRYSDALRLLQAVVAACEQLAGPSDPQAAAVLISLGVVCKYLGRYHEAEAHYLRAWRILTAPSPQPSPPNTSRSTTSRWTPDGAKYLGEREQGSSNEITSSFRASKRGQESFAGTARRVLRTNDSCPLLDATLWPLLYNLGGIAHAQSQYARGEKFARQALKLAEQVHGHEHPSVALAMSNLAANLEGLGRDDEAKSLYERSAEIVQAAYGPWHRDVAMNLNNLAALVQRRGDLGRAEELYRRALRIKQRVLGSEHADVAVTMNNLAYLYRLQGRHREAEPLFRRALHIVEVTFAPDHPKVLAIRRNIHSQGRPR